MNTQNVIAKELSEKDPFLLFDLERSDRHIKGLENSFHHIYHCAFYHFFLDNV